jgi:hypothetical protein
MSNTIREQRTEENYLSKYVNQDVVARKNTILVLAGAIWLV